MHVKYTLQYKLRPDLEVFIEGEFEIIFSETRSTNKNTVVGSIYRPPNTNIALSIQRFANIFNQIKDSNTIIGTDQTFDLLNIESHNYIFNLNSALENGVIPTITKPTRIIHNSATLIDNIYVNYTANNPHIQSAIIIHDISDHLPVISSLSYPNKQAHCIEPLTFEHRQITQSSLDKISND